MNLHVSDSYDKNIIQSSEKSIKNIDNDKTCVFFSKQSYLKEAPQYQSYLKLITNISHFVILHAHERVNSWTFSLCLHPYEVIGNDSVERLAYI